MRDTTFGYIDPVTLEAYELGHEEVEVANPDIDENGKPFWNFKLHLTTEVATRDAWIAAIDRNEVPDPDLSECEYSRVMRQTAFEDFERDPRTTDTSLLVAVARLQGLLPPRDATLA
jgi:hypothetical protein